MYVCYSRSKNESHAKAVLYHLESWGFTMPEEDGEKNIMREVTYEQECESIARHQEAVVVLTPQLIQDITALVELDILKSSFEKGRIKIVVFYTGLNLLHCRKDFRGLERHSLCGLREWNRYLRECAMQWQCGLRRSCLNRVILTAVRRNFMRFWHGMRI